MPRKKKQTDTPTEPTEDTPVRRRRALPEVEVLPVVPEEEQETIDTPAETPDVPEQEPEVEEDELETLDNQPDPEFVKPPEEPEPEPVSKPELQGEIVIPLTVLQPPAADRVTLVKTEEPRKATVKYHRYSGAYSRSVKGSKRYGVQL